jgi:GNAT superfamily N-acetyltransferase
MLRVFQAQTDKDLETIKTLFAEYADSLGFDLDFQNFEEELTNLSGEYIDSAGCLLLAEYKGQIVGCVGLKQFGDGICEMKRLYVRPEFRGLGIGKALAKDVIKEAKKIGYNRMRLDMVLPRDAPRELYISLGFKDIEPYRYNPIEGAVFMELTLAQDNKIQ